MLTEYAIGALKTAGVRSIWLAATEAGRPIYRRLGFEAISTQEFGDQIQFAGPAGR